MPVQHDYDGLRKALRRSSIFEKITRIENPKERKLRLLAEWEDLTKG